MPKASPPRSTNWSSEAEKNGFAIGIGAGLEVTIETVAEFARELQERGMLLVPISATFKGQMR